MRRGNVEERQRGKWCGTRGKRLADTLGLADACRLADGWSFHFVSDLFISIFFFEISTGIATVIWPFISLLHESTE